MRTNNKKRSGELTANQANKELNHIMAMTDSCKKYDRLSGFPHDYIIDRDVNGDPITRSDQVARCGNAVCPAVAEALVRANLPEYCKKKISDMAQLHSVMTS